MRDGWVSTSGEAVHNTGEDFDVVSSFVLGQNVFSPAA
jgi:hypothetical protein